MQCSALRGASRSPLAGAIARKLWYPQLAKRFGWPLDTNAADNDLKDGFPLPLAWAALLEAQSRDTAE